MGTKKRVGLRLKFGIFISCLMIISTLLTGVLLIGKLSDKQIEDVESFLRLQGETADSILILNYFDKSVTIKDKFIDYWGSDYSRSLKEVMDQSFFLYDNQGEMISKFYGGDIHPDTEQIMQMALSGKIAYYRSGNDIVYYWPLKNGVEQIGVLVIIYDISERVGFIESVKSGYIYLGVGIAALSILISYMYFSSHIKKISIIIDKIRMIENGDFKSSSLIKTNDEIRTLDEGVENMRSSISTYVETISEDKKELSRAVEKLSISDEKQKLFFSSITHEFKTPLSIIMAHSDLIQMYDDPNMRSTSVDNIKKEAMRLHQMIESALELSSIDRYDTSEINEYMDISELIKDTITRMQMKAEKFNIKIESELDNCMINTNREMMDLVMINLVDNGIKYNSTEGIVRLTGKVCGEDYIIVVEDTGTGIPKEHRDKVFDEFYVVDKSRSKKTGGTGLGLSIVKKYLDKLGYDINIDESLLGGAKVTIKIKKVYNDETIG